MSSRACPNVQGLACLSHTNTLLTDGLHCCLLCWWSCRGSLWYLGTFTPFHTTRCLAVFKQLPPFFMLCTRYPMCSCTIWGKCLCLGLSRPADPSSSNLLSASSARHLLLSDGNLQGNTEVFLRKPETQCYIRVRLALCLRRGVHAVFGHCSQEALSLLLFPPRPPASQMFPKVNVTEVWSRTVGCYCIWKPSTSGSSTLTSKIKRIPSFHQLSCYLPMYMYVGCLKLGPEKMTLCWVDT